MSRRTALLLTGVVLGCAIDVLFTAELVHHDPLEPEDVRRLRRRVGAVLAPVASEVAKYRPQMLVGTSGTLCDLARMAAARSGAVPESVNQLSVAKQDLAAVHARLLALPAAARSRLAGLEAKRADIVPAGSVVLMVAMDLFGLDALTVGEWALREGIVIDAIGHHDPADWGEDPRVIRRSSVAGLARRCGADEGHGRQVARLAGEIFDATITLHHLGRDDRELLEHAAVLHDIGEHVSVDSHHKHTAYLIQHGRLRGFSPDDVNILACLGRFHRRGDPKTSFEPYAALDEPARQRVTEMSAILRLADGLDRSHSGTVRSVDVSVERRGEVVHLAVESTGDAELELWGVRRKRDLFERVFDCRLEVSLAEPQVEAAPA